MSEAQKVSVTAAAPSSSYLSAIRVLHVDGVEETVAAVGGVARMVAGDMLLEVIWQSPPKFTAGDLGRPTTHIAHVIDPERGVCIRCGAAPDALEGCV